MPLTLAGATSGSTTLQATDAVTATLTLPSSTGTLVTTASPTFTGTATIPTATVTTLNTPSGVLATQNGMTGIAKAWGSYAYAGVSTVPTVNGTPFNVTSITQNGTGDYTFALTTAMPNANYPVVMIANQGLTVGGSTSCIAYLYARSTTSFSVYTGYVNSTSGNIAARSMGLDFAIFSS